MLTTSLLLALALAADPSKPAAEPNISPCELTSIDMQAVPGTDPGVLILMHVKEGMLVKKGMEIARIDDAEARAEVDVKQFAYDAAQQTANSDIDIRHSRAAAAVAKAALQKFEESNKEFKGTVTYIDILKAQLELKKSELAIEQTQEKQVEARLTAKAKLAEVGAAKVALERRILRAPFDGIVVKVSKKPGEWVAPGDPVVQMVGIERLRVMGDVDATEWGQTDVEGRRVTVQVTLPRGRTVSVPGRVTYVSPVVTLGRLEVWAEIAPEIKDGLPLVHAGLPAAMTIHVNQPAVAHAPAYAPPPAPASNPAAAPAAAPVRKTSSKAAPKR
ncbi:MAG TPA: HlyD family efflux transporter periplasmic adaptor subunit [Pirellulales bacterium]|nr:HlyD family efflux transporter periplasmic adaptor subunit [Pirellulales bacterium]